MLPAIMAAARAYAPWMVFPFAVMIGGIGYALEGAVSDKHTPWKESAIERRQKRLLSENDSNIFDKTGEIQTNSLTNPDFVPKTIFEKNVSPGLQK